MLNKTVTPESLDNFLIFLEKNSFDFDIFGYYFIERKEFFYDSVLIDVTIDEEKLKNFLEKNSKFFNIIGTQLIKEINSRM